MRRGRNFNRKFYSHSAIDYDGNVIMSMVLYYHHFLMWQKVVGDSQSRSFLLPSEDRVSG